MIIEQAEVGMEVLLKSELNQSNDLKVWKIVELRDPEEWTNPIILQNVEESCGVIVEVNSIVPFKSKEANAFIYGIIERKKEEIGVLKSYIRLED